MRRIGPGRMLLVLLATCVTAGAADLRVSLREEVVLAAPVATLGDIAELEGPAALVERFAGITVQPLYDLAPVTITPGLVRASLARRLDGVTLALSGRTTLTRQSRTFSREDLIACVRADLEARIGERDRRLRPVRVTGELEVAADSEHPAELQAEALTSDLWGQVPYRVRALRDGEELGRCLVVFSVAVYQEVPVATRDLPTGHRIGLEDLETQRRELDRRSGGAPAALRDLVGRVCRRRVARGQIVERGRTRAPTAVHGGRGVTLIYRRKGFELRATGTALSDAGADETVRVRQPNGHVIVGRVEGDGRVVIGDG
ncbi:MAG: flagellar basal body P-ring formation chaperone FlgA [Planctomycetota bacterium]